MKNKLLLSLALLSCTTSTIIPKQGMRAPQQQIQQRQRIQQQPRKPRQIQQQNIPQTPRLSQYPFAAGSALPVFMDQSGKIYVILSREGHGKDKGTYDDFGGKRDKGERHPLITAAREFSEEAITPTSIGLSFQDIRNYIDIENKADNTQFIIANAHNVMYIVDFTAYADKFFDNFYKSLATATSGHSREKDSIAVVELDILRATIAQSKFNSNVKVNAFILNPSGQRWDLGQITLRGFLTKKTRPFFTNQPYQPGAHQKIRFYDQIPNTATVMAGTSNIQLKKTVVRPRTIKAGNRRSWLSRLFNWN